MKRLILMRHAKTEGWTEGVDDHGRALTQSGHQTADRMGLALKSIGWVPERAIISTARRTRETWAHLSGVFPNCDFAFEDGLYLAGERGIVDFISEHDGAGTLMVLGHNPGMHDLAVSIMRASGSADHRSAIKLAAKLPTGACALYESEEDGAFLPVHFLLQTFLRPKDLPDLAY
ncbi:MAG: histidine phosphatase family protein [Pseudomonadota bacterium]